MKKAGIISILVLAISLVGCSALSVISAISNWLPFGISVFDGVVSVAAPGNTKLVADGAAVQRLFGTIQSDVAAAQAAPGTGLQKVLADIQAVLPSVQSFETDVEGFGISIPAQDQQYISASVAVLEAALEGFEAELQSQVKPAVALKPVNIQTAEGTFIRYADGSYYASFTADPTDAINYASGGEAVAANPAASKKAPKLGSFKRQFNAIAKKYGHADKQLKLSLLEKLHIK